MTDKEFEIYENAIHEKYKYHTLWKVLTIILLCTTILFACLYFGSGAIFTKITNKNEIEIQNEGDGNKNFVTINN